jgi:SAM-dependent methyltransferase
VCDSYQRAFEPHGVVRRPDARCPDCGSLERHRLAWLYLKEEMSFLDGSPRVMLHLAPEPALERPLRAVRGLTRITADLLRGRIMVRLDVTRLPFGRSSFDAIYCSHVLEHVPDDAAAMRELRRVLRPGGWAILQVPVLREVTDEDPTVVLPEERLKRFGQEDHVRTYGRDFADRLARSGFEVRVDDYAQRLAPEKRAYLGLDPRENIYLCRRPAVG